jgi:hypothetical protein
VVDPDKRIPTAALILGWMGVLPFAALALFGIFGAPGLGDIATCALIGYGAIILSFMGGAQWGATMMRRPTPEPAASWLGYGVSVLPALLGWAALALPAPAALGVFPVGFGLLLIYDLASARRGDTPAWYPRLRAPLTITVIACLTAALLAGHPG